MKNILFTISLIFCMSISLAQEINVPENISKTFDSQINAFNDCENIVWSQKDNNFIASYNKKSLKNITSFALDGRIVEQLEQVNVASLEENVLNYIDVNYKKGKITECYTQSSETAPNRSVVEVKHKGNVYRLFFRPDGTFHYEEKIEL